MFKTLIILFALSIALFCNLLLLLFLGINLDIFFYQEITKAFFPNLLGLIFAVIVVESLISFNRKSSYKKLNTYTSIAIHNDIRQLLEKVADLLEINKDKKELIRQTLMEKNFDLFFKHFSSAQESVSHDFLLKIENKDFRASILNLIDDEFYEKKLNTMNKLLEEGFEKISAHLEKVKPYPTRWVLHLMENEFYVTQQFTVELLKQQEGYSFPLGKENLRTLLKAYAGISESLFRKLITLSGRASNNLLFEVID